MSPQCLCQCFPLPVAQGPCVSWVHDDFQNLTMQGQIVSLVYKLFKDNTPHCRLCHQMPLNAVPVWQSIEWTPLSKPGFSHTQLQVLCFEFAFRFCLIPKTSSCPQKNPPEILHAGIYTRQLSSGLNLHFCGGFYTALAPFCTFQPSYSSSEWVSSQKYMSSLAWASASPCNPGMVYQDQKQLTKFAALQTCFDVAAF